MEPWSQLIGVGVGLGFQLFGMSGAQSAAKDYNSAQTQQIQLEQQADSVRRQQMESSASRMKLENFRKVQQASSLALANATSQGAGTGTNSSGLAGGQGQIRSQGAWNEEGINKNLQFGEQMFSINSQINNAKISQANAQMSMQTSQAWSSLGKDISGSAGAIGRLGSGFSGNSSGMWNSMTNNFMGSGSFNNG